MLHRRYFYPEDHGKDAKHKSCTAIPLLPQWQSTDVFFSKVIFFHLRLNWSLSLTTAFCETKMQSVKTEHKCRVDNTKGVQKKRTRYARYNRSTTKKTFPFTEHALTNTKRYL